MVWTSDGLAGPAFRLPSSDPSDADVVDLVKLWGDAAGLLGVAGGRVGAAWTMYAGERGLIIHHADCLNKWMGDSDTLLVWALAVISGRTVTLGKCSECGGRGFLHRTVDREADARSRAWLFADGWDCEGGSWEKGERRYTKPCSECSTTGVVRREAARLVLDAAPREGRWALTVHDVGWGSWQLMDGDRPLSRPYYADDAVNTRVDVYHGLLRSMPDSASIETGDVLAFDAWRPVVRSPGGCSATLTCVQERPGDPSAIEHLHVFSGLWEGEGDPLGAAASNWLRQMELRERIEGWRGAALARVLAAWRRLTVPCPACSTWIGAGPCRMCNGHGRLRPDVINVESRGCTDSPDA
jgi:hypothetical protein